MLTQNAEIKFFESHYQEVLLKSEEKMIQTRPFICLILRMMKQLCIFIGIIFQYHSILKLSMD